MSITALPPATAGALAAATDGMSAARMARSEIRQTFQTGDIS
jgi:hypothetical protein